jgi:hypothetical protein
VKARGLDLDQEFSADDVDDEAFQLYLEPVAWLGVRILQGCMQRLFI